MATASLADFLAVAVFDGAVPWSAEREAARLYGLGAREVEAAALTAGLLPARYSPERRHDRARGPARPPSSGVAVAGCGGLGGYIVEELARLGVGTILVADPDVFEAEQPESPAARDC